MGSTGSGKFTDYSGRSNNSQSGEGGSSGDDICQQAFSAGLEDIEEYDFFNKNQAVPSVGSSLSLTNQGRIVALDASGLSIGALPSKYNYLAGCLKAGFSYNGIVRSSAIKPSCRVSADFAPT